MRKDCVGVFVSLLAVCSVSHAALLFKMEAPQVDLLPGETVTVTVSAWADDAAAAGSNGLNGWGLSALVDQTGVVQVVPDSIVFVAPSPWSADDTFAESINSPVTGGTGSIADLQLITASVPQASATGVGGYSQIVKFNIQAIGGIGQSVQYTLGGNTFSGLLRNFTEMNGQFDAAQSQYQFTIVPEPASMLVLTGLSVLGLRRRK